MSAKNQGFRLRKAWEVTYGGYPSQTYFAPTAGKARVQALSDLSDCGGTHRLIDIRAVRAPNFDVKLPERHPLADALSPEEISCLLHSYGAGNDPFKAGCRSHFFTSWDDKRLCALSERGLMKPRGNSLSETEGHFYMTDLGKLVARSLVPEYRP